MIVIHFLRRRRLPSLESCHAETRVHYMFLRAVYARAMTFGVADNIGPVRQGVKIQNSAIFETVFLADTDCAFSQTAKRLF